DVRVRTPATPVRRGGNMHERLGRRDFLRRASALAAAGAPLWMIAARTSGEAGGRPPGGGDQPAGRGRRHGHEGAGPPAGRGREGGRRRGARFSQPGGRGPSPALRDRQGGAGNARARLANEPMDRAVAASGVLVVAIDLTLAPEAPYPASVQDANYGVRWLKS